ncbi:MAG: energy transducer TonB [Thermodesulfovibrionales bacterium]|nr:energy transducer TonB [Thermodesulfovibrionales bacterium]
MIDISILCTNVESVSHENRRQMTSVSDNRVVNKPANFKEVVHERQKTYAQPTDIKRMPIEQKTVDAFATINPTTTDYQGLKTNTGSVNIADAIDYQDAKKVFKGQSSQHKVEAYNDTSITTNIQSEATIDKSAIIGAFINKVESAKQYPYIARRKGMEGTVIVLVHLSKTGELIDIALKKSSGHDILDSSAIELLKKVCPFRHNYYEDLKIEIPITYNLLK